MVSVPRLALAAVLVAGVLVPAGAVAAQSPAYSAIVVDSQGAEPSGLTTSVVHGRQGQGTGAIAPTDGGGVRVEVTSPESYSSLELDPPSGSPLAVGSFPVTTAAATASAGRLGYYCYPGSGTVDVLELERDAEQRIVAFAATWTLSCGGVPVHGAMYFASSIGFRAAVTPDRLVLPTVAVGSSSTATTTILSAGPEPLTLGTPSVAGQHPADFTVTGTTCGGALAPGATCTVDVSFAPTAGGPRHALLTMTDDSPRGARTLRLAGTGTAVPAAPRVRDQRAFGGVLLNWEPPVASPPVTSYRVYRDGTLLGTTTGSAYSDTSMAPGSSARYEVRAVNTMGEGPGVPLDVTVPTESPAPGTVDLVYLDYDGERPRAFGTEEGIAVTRYYPFGLMELGSNQFGVSFQAWRDGDALVGSYHDGGVCDPGWDVVVHELAVRATGEPLLAAMTATCPGSRVAEIRWHSTRPVSAVVSSPSRLEPYSGNTALPPTKQRVTVRNRGTLPAPLGQATVGGTDAGQWAVAADTCSGTGLAPGASCGFDVEYRPTARGDHHGEVTIADGTASGRRRISLEGRAQSPPAALTDVVLRAGVGRLRVEWRDPASESWHVKILLAEGDGPFRAIATAYDSYGGPPPTFYDITAVVPGRRYRVVVEPYNSFGTGPRSAPLTATVPLQSVVHTVWDEAADRWHLASTPVGGGRGFSLFSAEDARWPEVNRRTGEVTFSRRTAGGRQIWETSPYGGSARAVTTEAAANDVTPSVAPEDDQQMVFSRRDANGVAWSYLRIPWNGNLVSLGLGGAYSPSWLPGAREFVVVRNLTSGTFLEVVSVDGSTRQKIAGTDGAGTSEVSPDGQWIAFSHFPGASLTSSVMVVPITGGTPRTIASPGGYNDSPTWSADGRTVFFEHGALAGADDVQPTDIWSAVATGPVATANVTNTPDLWESEPAVHDVQPWQPRPLVHRALDYTGDRRADPAVFRPSTGQWHIRGVGVFTWGRSGDVPVPADYNGDGRADLAVFRPSEGIWYVRGVGTFRWGQAGDYPVPADYNGDGRADVAVFRQLTGTWHVRGMAPLRYGSYTDVPIPGNYLGDRRAEHAVYRQYVLHGFPAFQWHIRGSTRIFVHGEDREHPLPANFTGDGRVDFATFQPWGAYWYVGASSVQFGHQADQAVLGDFTGDGRTELTVFRPSNGGWYVRGVATLSFGRRGDIPV